MSHSINILLGAPALATIKDLRKCLAWYAKHPRIAATARGLQNIARLHRQLDGTTSEPSATTTTIANH